MRDCLFTVAVPSFPQVEANSCQGFLPNGNLFIGKLVHSHLPTAHLLMYQHSTLDLPTVSPALPRPDIAQARPVGRSCVHKV